MLSRRTRFGADLLANCWQAKIFCQHAWDKNFQRSCRNRWKKAKKIPHPQTKVQESLVPPAGIEPARYRYRGILSPLRLPVPPWRRVFIITEWARAVKPCPLQKNDFTRRRTNSAKCRSFSCAVLSQFLLNTDLSSAPS